MPRKAVALALCSGMEAVGMTVRRGLRPLWVLQKPLGVAVDQAAHAGEHAVDQSACIPAGGVGCKPSCLRRCQTFTLNV
jgi:hypothetical protein